MRESVQADGLRLPQQPVPEEQTHHEEATPQAAYDQANLPRPPNEAYYPELGSGGFHILNNILNGNTYPKHNEVKFHKIQPLVMLNLSTIL